jgi:hypothetical protein
MRLSDLVRRGTLCAMILALILVPTGYSQASSVEQRTTFKAGLAARGAAEGEEIGPISTSEKQGYGCMIAGAAGLAMTFLVGSADVVLLFTGAAALPATSSAGIGLTVLGTAVASTCAVGALVAPTTERLWKYYFDGAKIVNHPVG